MLQVDVILRIGIGGHRRCLGRRYRRLGRRYRWGLCLGLSLEDILVNARPPGNLRALALCERAPVVRIPGNVRASRLGAALVKAALEVAAGLAVILLLAPLIADLQVVVEIRVGIHQREHGGCLGL